MKEGAAAFSVVMAGSGNAVLYNADGLHTEFTCELGKCVLQATKQGGQLGTFASSYVMAVCFDCHRDL